MVQSPLNYTGGKFKLLPQLLPLFPKNVSVFWDIFCGGGNVGININCEGVVFNDCNADVIEILKLFAIHPSDYIVSKITSIINQYGLSLVKEHSYEYYGCNSQDGLGVYNLEPYKALRRDVNEMKQRDELYYLCLYVLVIYAFNNQIRFNKHHAFNLPVGKRDFNEKMEDKLIAFCNELKTKDCSFSSLDFREIDLKDVKHGSFIYADPPYLITCASYNEQDGWNNNDEIDLLKYLDKANEMGIRFALSNVLESKGQRNEILYEWITEHKKYKCHHLHYSYRNSNYHRSEDFSNSDEILIVNY